MIYNKQKQSIEQSKLTVLEQQLTELHKLLHNQPTFILINMKMVEGVRVFGVEAIGNGADSLSYLTGLKKTGGSYIG